MKSIFTWLFLLSAYTLVAQAPVNDECSGAIELFVDDSTRYSVPTSMTMSATYSTLDVLFNVPFNEVIFDSPQKDLWFKFTATSSFLHIDSDAFIYLYKGDDCNNLEYVNLGYHYLPPVYDLGYNVFSGLEIGEVYYIRTFCWGGYNLGDMYDYEIELTTNDPCGNNADPLSFNVDLDYSNEIFTPIISGGTPPYVFYQCEWDNMRELPLDSLNEQMNSVFGPRAEFLVVSDADNCARMISLPGEIPMNINKVALVDYKMSVFPNPAQYSSKLSLSVEKATEMQIQISNISGQVLSSEVVLVEGDMVFDLNISDLPNGVYLVSAMSEVGIQTKELVISK